MTAADWHDAQVIEATTDTHDRIILNRTEGHSRYRYEIPSGKPWLLDELADVRVIVDRDGRVVPPEVNEEMIERSAEAGALVRRGVTAKVNDGDREFARAALTVALGGRS